VPVTSWEQFQKEYLNNLNQDITFTVKRDSGVVDLLYRKEWFSEKNAEFLDIWYRPEARVGNVHGNTPAMDLGLQKGDLILSLNSKPVADWYEMTRIIRDHPEQEIGITWSRNGQQMSGVISPAKFQEKDSLGNEIAVGKIGIEQFYEEYPVSLPTAIVNGFRDTFGLIALNMRGIWWVISQTKSVEEVLGGPIMIAKMAGDAAAAGWEPLWTLIAALSAILAFFNILPIPALDGGHLLLLTIEGITRKPISTRTRLIVQQVGMAILLTLIVFILYVDIRRLITG
jgi:regulator of sigma E protease